MSTAPGQTRSSLLVEPRRSRFGWYFKEDAGTDAGATIHLQRAADKFGSFHHPDEPELSAIGQVAEMLWGFEVASVIGDSQPNASWMELKLDVDLFGVGVALGVVDCSLPAFQRGRGAVGTQRATPDTETCPPQMRTSPSAEKRAGG